MTAPGVNGVGLICGLKILISGEAFCWALSHYTLDSLSFLNAAASTGSYFAAAHGPYAQAAIDLLVSGP